MDRIDVARGKFARAGVFVMPVMAEIESLAGERFELLMHIIPLAHADVGDEVFLAGFAEFV